MRNLPITAILGECWQFQFGRSQRDCSDFTRTRRAILCFHIGFIFSQRQVSDKLEQRGSGEQRKNLQIAFGYCITGSLRPGRLNSSCKLTVRGRVLFNHHGASRAADLFGLQRDDADRAQRG